MKESYGETVNDSRLIKEAGKSTIWNSIFDDTRKSSELQIDPLIEELKGYEVVNMRNGNLERLKSAKFSDLINIIYQIRCNLFHGRKDPNDFQDSKDYKLIRLAHLILAPVVFKYLESEGLVYFEPTEEYLDSESDGLSMPTTNACDFEEGFEFGF